MIILRTLENIGKGNNNATKKNKIKLERVILAKEFNFTVFLTVELHTAKDIHNYLKKNQINHSFWLKFKE